jgi:predicted hydrocarbon binding protein
VTQATLATVHALVPLSVLEAMRLQDVPQPDGLEEYHIELTTKRLGMSHTVERQIARYEELAAREARVPRDEVLALFRLAERRPDADLLFADAGRRAGRRAAQRVGGMRLGMRRALPGRVGRWYGLRLASEVLREILDVELGHDGERFVAESREALTHEASQQGTACAFLGSAIAAVLRAYADFEGAVVHERCRARGADRCRWVAAARGG